jgi:hypothetical protein
MAELTVKSITQSGVQPVPVAAADLGDTFDNDGATFFHALNGSAGSITVTFTAQNGCSQGFDHDIAVAVPAGEERMIGPFEKYLYDNADEEVEVTYEAHEDLTVDVFKFN